MKFVMRHKRWFIALVALGLGVYFVGKAGFFGPTIPSEFESARLQGALIAESIVSLSKKSTESLRHVNELEAQSNFTEASNLIADLVKESQEIRRKAVELSGELERMTQALSSINSFDARQAALESIANRLALINRLINYSSYLSDLLNVLDKRFSGDPGNGQEIETLVSQINAEVIAINSFNEQAGQAMSRFDAVIRGN